MRLLTAAAVSTNRYFNAFQFRPMTSLKLGNCDDDVVNALPDNMQVRGDLAFDRPSASQNVLMFDRPSASQKVPHFRRLPRNLKVSGNLQMQGCKNLSVIPEGLAVAGDVDLLGCFNLTGLPDAMLIGGNLNLGFCSQITELPQVMKVGGDINLEYCHSLKNLPYDMVFGGEHIYIAASGIEESTLRDDLRKRIAKTKESSEKLRRWHSRNIEGYVSVKSDQDGGSESGKEIIDDVFAENERAEMTVSHTAIIGANLSKAEFEGDFSHAKLMNCNFTGAKLLNVDFRGADVSNAIGLDETDFFTCQWQGADFTGVDNYYLASPCISDVDQFFSDCKGVDLEFLREYIAINRLTAKVFGDRYS